jgi:hypothetical protein
MMIRTCALIAVLIAGALFDFALGGDLVECELQRVTGDGRHWAYRIVDGRECWYPGRPGKPKNELFWDRGTTPSARQPLDQPEAETEPSEPPSQLAAAPPEKPEIAEAPGQWHAAAADQLLAFTCCWPELEGHSLPPQTTSEGGQPVPPEEGRPPAWPLALLPLGLYALWWIGKPRGGLRAVRAGLTRLHRHNASGGVREHREASGAVRERPRIRRDEEHLSPGGQSSTGVDESVASLFVLSANEQQHVALASLVDAPDPMAQSSVRSRRPGLYTEFCSEVAAFNRP